MNNNYKSEKLRQQLQNSLRRKVNQYEEQISVTKQDMIGETKRLEFCSIARKGVLTIITTTSPDCYINFR